MSRATAQVVAVPAFAIINTVTRGRFPVRQEPVQQGNPLVALTHQDMAQAVRQRLSEKVERVKAGAQKWADSGRDPSEVLRAMEEKFKPLMESGKAVEAEAELDEVLKQFAQDAK